MAVIIKTNDPSGLLKAIRKGVDEKKIVAWSFDADGDFIAKDPPSKNMIWLRPKIYVGELRFGILMSQDVPMTKLIYGFYHGRFTEMVLTHYDTMLTSVNSTSNKTEPDNFT